MSLAITDRRRLRPILEEIAALGGTVEAVDRGKHFKVRWTIAGARLLCTVSYSSSDHRALQNNLAAIRRAAREAQAR